MKCRTQKQYARVRNRKWLKVKDFLQLIAPASYKRTQKIRHNKWIKKITRQYQSLHYGKHPDLSVIPDGLYCDTCPYYYTLHIPMSENPVGWVATCQRVDDKTVYIGGCKLINKTDNDFNGWGLLWDGCKECGVNDE